MHCLICFQAHAPSHRLPLFTLVLLRPPRQSTAEADIVCKWRRYAAISAPSD